MYRKGHYGVALLTFAPIGFALVRADEPELAFLTGATMLWFAMLPDVDHRLPLISHRGVTHTLVFAALVGGVFAVVGALAGGALGPVVGDPPVGTDGVLAGVGLAGFGFVLGALTVCTHLLGDVLTPSGVALLWPLSNRRYTLGVTPAKSRLANYGLLAAGLAAVGAAAWLAVTV